MQDGYLHIDETQPGRRKVLEHNAVLAKEGLGRKGAVLQPGLRLPKHDYNMLRRRNPDLACRDAQIENKAWQKLMRSSEGAPYRLYTAGRSRNRSYGGLPDGRKR